MPAFHTPIASGPVAAGLILAALIAASSGCRPEEPIRTYRVAKSPGDTAPRETALPDTAAPRETPTGEPNSRMLGAIVPGQRHAWFFKAVGPIEQVDAAAEGVIAWLRTIKVDGERPEWELPDGWRKGGASQMRLATLYAPAGKGELEVSVIGLPLVDDWSSQVLDNVNRWRGQLALPSLDAASLDESTQPLDEVAADAVLFDERGWYESGPMAPMAGGPTRPSPAAAPKPAGELIGDIPDGWTDAPGSAMRRASYATPGGADVAAFAFPAGGGVADSMLTMWRGEVGLPPDAPPPTAESIELLGAEGSFYKLAGPERTAYAATVVHEGRSWFFRLSGPTNEADTQEEAFRDWVASLKLSSEAVP